MQTTSARSTAPARTAARREDLAPSGADEVVIVVDLRDPRTGAAAAPDPSGAGLMVGAVHDAHSVLAAHGGRPVALLGNHLVGAFPAAAVQAGIAAAVELQQRAGAAAWSCAIALATGPDPQPLDSASVGFALVGGAVDRALLLVAWTDTGAVVADDRTVAVAERGAGERTGAGAGERPPGSGWAIGTNHLLVGHDREPVPYWDITFGPPEVGQGADGPRPGPGHAGADGSDDRAPTTDHEARAATAQQGEQRDRSAAGAGGAAPQRLVVSRSAPESQGGSPSSPTRAGVRARLDQLAPDRPLPRPVAPPRTADEPAATPVVTRPWSRGEVRCWFPNRGRGVIGSTTTQEFYVDRRFLAVPAAIATGDRVYFLPRDAVGGGRNPAASAVLVVGAEVEVRVDHVDDRGFGVSNLRDPAGTAAPLLLDLAADSTTLAVTPGDWLLVRIQAGEHGPVGVPI